MALTDSNAMDIAEMNARAAALDSQAGLKPGKTVQRRPMTRSRRFTVPTRRREATGAAQTPLEEGAAKAATGGSGHVSGNRPAPVDSKV